MKKFSASVLIVAVLCAFGATAAIASETSVLEPTAKSGSFTIQTGLWPH